MRFVRTLMVLSFLAFCLSNCIVYKTVDVQVSAETFQKYILQKKHWAIQNGVDSARFARIDEVHADGFTATLGDVQRRRDHPKEANRKTYWRGMGAYSMKVVHLELTDGTQLSPVMKLSYADVKAATAHKESFLTWPLSAVAAVVYWFILYTINPLQ